MAVGWAESVSKVSVGLGYMEKFWEVGVKIGRIA